MPIRTTSITARAHWIVPFLLLITNVSPKENRVYIYKAWYFFIVVICSLVIGKRKSAFQCCIFESFQMEQDCPLDKSTCQKKKTQPVTLNS